MKEIKNNLVSKNITYLMRYLSLLETITLLLNMKYVVVNYLYLL